MWMYVPNYERHGHITNIQNVTKFDNPHKKYWESLRHVRTVDEHSLEFGLNKTQTDGLQAMIEFYHKHNNPYQNLETKDKKFLNLLNFTNVKYANQLAWP